MSHIFLVWWGQNRVKHSTPLLCFAEEIDLFVVYEIRRQNVLFISENTILIKRTLAKDCTLSPYWKNDLPPTIFLITQKCSKDRTQTTY